MARFAFIVPPLTGHVNPTLSLGAVLLSRGHEVGWISLDASLGERLPAGGQLLLISYEENDEKKQQNAEYLDIISRKNVYGIDSVRFLYEEVLIPLNRHCYEGIRQWLQVFQPELAIVDHQLFTGAVAAIQEGIPYVTTVTAPAAIKVMEELPKVHEWEEKQVIALQQELGLSGEASVACSPLLTMVLTSRAFFGEMELPEYYRFVGPVLHRRENTPSFDWDGFHADTRRKVLVSIGTTFDHAYKKAFFTKVAEALADADLGVVVVSDPELLESWPDNFLVRRQVPQLELLPYLSMVVSHGGHNTVSETLTNGLPLVVIPIAYDQSHVAGRVVRVGAGVRLNYNRFKAKHLREAIDEVLGNPAYRLAAQFMQESFREAGGVSTAADLLEQVGQPIC